MLLFSMIVLDVFYTVIYLKNDSRNKVFNIFNSGPKKYDVLILGSSRAENHLVSSVFYDNGYTVFNYGMSGSRLAESNLLLNLMLERNYKIKTLIVETDLNINSDGYSEGTRACFMPYIHQSKTIRDFYKNIPDYTKVVYIPFYRYIKYESKIGFREMLFSALHKKSNCLENQGFYPLLHDARPLVAKNLSNYVPHKNKSLDNIKEICKKNNIQLLLITTPICNNTINREYFNHIKEIYPEIRRFENAVTDDKYFSTCGHMNQQGAIKFTEIVFNAFFKPKNKT